MRRKLVLGLGLTGLLTGSAAAQFGSPPTPPARAPFGGGVPVGTPSVPALPMTPPPAAAGSYVRPVGAFTPAGPATPSNTFRPATAPGATTVVPVEIELALGPNHPLLVKPEDGAYFICVKSYSRPHKPDKDDAGLTVKQLGEALAADIQQTQHCRVFLYELVSEEKRAEAVARTAAKQRALEFKEAMKSYKQKSELQGMDFLEDRQTIQFHTYYYRDQVAVLVGGYKTEEEAVKELARVKKWPLPRNELMDVGSISTRRPDGKSEIERKFINPYATAMVVQNPAIAKQLTNASTSIDPFVVRLNEGRPYSLLKATKSWTLVVKAFTAPVHFTSKDEAPMAKKFELRGRLDHLFDTSSSGADVLRAGTEQAEALAKSLSEMKDKTGQPMHLEAFVLHTRGASIVTVGQFDSPNDPEMLEKQRILSNLKFNLSRDDKGTQITSPGEKLFDNVMPLSIPRH